MPKQHTSLCSLCCCRDGKAKKAKKSKQKGDTSSNGHGGSGLGAGKSATAACTEQQEAAAADEELEASGEEGHCTDERQLLGALANLEVRLNSAHGCSCVPCHAHTMPRSHHAPTGNAGHRVSALLFLLLPIQCLVIYYSCSWCLLYSSSSLSNPAVTS